MRVVSGLEILLTEQRESLKNKRLGLLANPATIGPDYRHALDLFDEYCPGAVCTLFGPQHGFVGEKQDNMVESAHAHDRLGRPIYSLYGETRRPTPEMLSGLDALIIDLPDVGTRVYTFAQTMSYCLEVAADLSLPLIILDRPNPIGGMAVEGNILQKDCASFVGLHPTPMRHGLTLAELALYFNGLLNKPANLKIIKCRHWSREMYFNETGLPWVLPSPNLPNPTGLWVYPGQVLWEGTNISEARGTTLPFQLFGAPFIDERILLQELQAENLPDLVCRPAFFQPTFHKWQNELCHGLELIPTGKNFKPYLTSLIILEIILRHWPHDFQLKEPPYEYEFERRPLDLILGDKALFDRLAQGESAKKLEDDWQDGLEKFMCEREEILLY